MRKILSACVALLVVVSTHATLTFTIDYSQDSNNFFNTQAKKDSFQAAANYVTSFVANTNLSGITPGSGNTWDTLISNPGSGSTTTFPDLTIAANTIVIYAGGRDLGGSTLGLGGHSGFSATGTQGFLDAIQFRGNGTFSMTSVGSIAFTTSASFTFYFDDNFNTIESGAVAGKIDFFSVAVHELGHVLGLGTNTSWSNLVSGHTFIGGASEAANSGVAVPLNAGNDHWAAGTTSTVFGTATVQEASMSPSISFGERKFYTTLDVAGLHDIGFVTAVPEPADFALGACAVMLGWCVWRRRRDAALTRRTSDL